MNLKKLTQNEKPSVQTYFNNREMEHYDEDKRPNSTLYIYTAWKYNLLGKL